MEQSNPTNQLIAEAREAAKYISEVANNQHIPKLIQRLVDEIEKQQSKNVRLVSVLKDSKESFRTLPLNIESKGWRTVQHHAQTAMRNITDALIDNELNLTENDFVGTCDNCWERKILVLMDINCEEIICRECVKGALPNTTEE